MRRYSGEYTRMSKQIILTMIHDNLSAPRSIAIFFVTKFLRYLFFFSDVTSRSCYWKTYHPTHWTLTGQFICLWCCTSRCWVWTTAVLWYINTANNCCWTYCWCWPTTRTNWPSLKFFWIAIRCVSVSVCPRRQCPFPNTTSRVSNNRIRVNS